MKKLIYVVLVALLVSGISSCTSYDYYVAGLNRTNLSRYHTFAWMPMAHNNGKVNTNMVADAKIKDAATAALVNKGLALNQRDPDLLISYSSIVGRGVRTYYYPTYYGSGIYPGMGFGMGYGFGYGGWGGWGGFYRPYYYAYGAPFAYYGGYTATGQEHYKEGTLIIDIIDRRSKQVVWRGFGVGEVHRNHQKDIDDLPKVVNGVLDQLSLAPSIAPPAGGRSDRRGPRGRGAVVSPTSSKSI
ncbi:DUF4136 domain-containing protein [Mucilaginibacter sp.]|uniref:DUF4136 domain-containing protein n=1 Tax=Mucilaginibacter sp. TaxID=1882438 RepID=UPI002622F7E4|nr:DUF4136 domain-containing protein [Mucilaginibacter sp.]MDB4925619.1 hypothetical protein [Mucilaginibacter sp.]